MIVIFKKRLSAFTMMAFIKPGLFYRYWNNNWVIARNGHVWEKARCPFSTGQKNRARIEIQPVLKSNILWKTIVLTQVLKPYCKKEKNIERFFWEDLKGGSGRQKLVSQLSKLFYNRMSYRANIQMWGYIQLRNRNILTENPILFLWNIIL